MQTVAEGGVGRRCLAVYSARPPALRSMTLDRGVRADGAMRPRYESACVAFSVPAPRLKSGSTSASGVICLMKRSGEFSMIRASLGMLAVLVALAGASSPDVAEAGRRHRHCHSHCHTHCCYTYTVCCHVPQPSCCQPQTCAYPPPPSCCQPPTCAVPGIAPAGTTATVPPIDTAPPTTAP